LRAKAWETVPLQAKIQAPLARYAA